MITRGGRCMKNVNRLILLDCTLFWCVGISDYAFKLLGSIGVLSSSGMLNFRGVRFCLLSGGWGKNKNDSQIYLHATRMYVASWLSMMRSNLRVMIVGGRIQSSWGL